MKRIAVAVTLAALATPVLASAQSIQGIWRLVQREVQGGPNAGVYPVQGGILVYGRTHFAWALDMAPQSRPVRESPSDAQVVEAIQFYTSTAGTYQLNGKEIRYQRTVNLAPAGMQPENQPQVRQVRSLTQDRLETSGTSADGITTILRYERVE